MLRMTTARALAALAVVTTVGGGTAVAQSPAAPVSFTYMTFVPQETDQVRIVYRRIHGPASQRHDRLSDRRS